YLCDYHVGHDNGKVDLYGIFNAIRSEQGFPHSHRRFCVFARLIGGQGQVPFFIDIRFAQTDGGVPRALKRRGGTATIAGLESRLRAESGPGRPPEGGTPTAAGTSDRGRTRRW